MKRRFTALGLAVAALVAASLQLGINPANSQTPTPTSGPLGSISGRIYVDVDADGVFGGPDVPLVFDLQLLRADLIEPPFFFQTSTSDGSDGTYQFTDLPPGDYELSILIPIPGLCAASIAPFTWVGDTFTGRDCPFLELSTQNRSHTLAPAEAATGIDFPQIPNSYDVTARAWLDSAPISPSSSVAVTVGGLECWNAQIIQVITAAGVPVSFYLASLLPTGNPACQHADLDITIDGRPASATTEWNRFWRDSLSRHGPRPLNQSSVGFLTSADLEIPPFLGISGQAVAVGTVTPQTVGSHTGILVTDNTEVRAFVGNSPCGSTRTKSLASATGGFGGNLFGLIVPPASVNPGCGTPGAQVTFCIGDFMARQPAAGPFSYFQSPEAKPVQWAAPAWADITLEPTTEPCLGAARTPTPAPGPDRPPASLPATGGRQD